MTNWNPYEGALTRLVAMSDEELRRYILQRLTGRATVPDYDISRNQESPEDFLIWANSRSNDLFRARLAAAVIDLASIHLNEYGAHSDRALQAEQIDILSRLLRVGEVIGAPPIAEFLRARLVTQGKLDLGFAKSLLAMAPAPWSESLLHQALGALSIIESQMGESPGRTRIAFWEPLLHEECLRGEGLPLDLRMIAFRALVRMGWKAAIENHLAYVVPHFEPREGASQSELDAAVTELANLLSFLALESRRQEASADRIARSPTLIEEPYPLVPGFRRYANHGQLLLVLSQSLSLLARSHRVFKGEPVSPIEWRDLYVDAILDEIGGFPSSLRSIRARVEIAKIDAETASRPADLPLLPLLYRRRQVMDRYAKRGALVPSVQACVAA
jgi:hypothetical protein